MKQFIAATFVAFALLAEPFSSSAAGDKWTYEVIKYTQGGLQQTVARPGLFQTFKTQAEAEAKAQEVMARVIDQNRGERNVNYSYVVK